MFSQDSNYALPRGKPKATCSRDVELEYRDQKFLWQIVCAYPRAHTKFGYKCLDSLCRERA